LGIYEAQAARLSKGPVERALCSVKVVHAIQRILHHSHFSSLFSLS
jgi:hypothetical protein